MPGGYVPEQFRLLARGRALVTLKIILLIALGFLIFHMGEYFGVNEGIEITKKQVERIALGVCAPKYSI